VLAVMLAANPTWVNASAGAYLLARVLLTAPAALADALALAELAPAMSERHTVRERFAPTSVDASLLRRLADAAASEGATLVVLEAEDQRQQAAALVAEGDAVQWASPSWRRELARVETRRALQELRAG